MFVIGSFLHSLGKKILNKPYGPTLLGPCFSFQNNQCVMQRAYKNNKTNLLLLYKYSARFKVKHTNTSTRTLDTHHLNSLNKIACPHSSYMVQKPLHKSVHSTLVSPNYLPNSLSSSLKNQGLHDPQMLLFIVIKGQCLSQLLVSLLL